jgi:hypothetical protein
VGVGESESDGLSGKATAQDEDIESGHFRELPQRAILRSGDYSMGYPACRSAQDPSGD